MIRKTVMTYLALLAVTTATPVWAQDDEKELGWADAAELTFVTASGNAESSTFGLRNGLTRTWENAGLTFDVGLLRSDSGVISRNAVGVSPLSFAVTKDSVTTKTAERYHARGQYNRQLNERMFWFAGSGWERNTFAGFDNRTSLVGGVGHTWVDDERRTFRTAYGLSFTVQDDVVETGGGNDSFAGLQLSYDYRRQLTATTEFTSVLVADQNLEASADFRTDLVNAISVSMTEQLALKISWQLLYDHQPALIGLPLINLGGLPTGDTVFAPLGTVDNLLTFALVATF